MMDMEIEMKMKYGYKDNKYLKGVNMKKNKLVLFN